MKTSDDPRWPTAVHEAGHAVASHLLGRGIRKASIVGDGRSLGHVEHYRRGQGWTAKVFAADYEGSFGRFINGSLRRSVEIEVMISLAGGLAEAKAMTVSHADVGMGLASTTSNEVAELADRFGGVPEEYEIKIVEGDYDYALDLACQVSGSDHEEGAAYLAWLECRTQNLMRDPVFEPCVEAVARSLIDKEVLSSREVKEAIAQGLEEFEASSV